MDNFLRMLVDYYNQIQQHYASQPPAQPGQPLAAGQQQLQGPPQEPGNPYNDNFTGPPGPPPPEWSIKQTGPGDREEYNDSTGMGYSYKQAPIRPPHANPHVSIGQVQGPRVVPQEPMVLPPMTFKVGPKMAAADTQEPLTIPGLIFQLADHIAKTKGKGKK